MNQRTLEKELAPTPLPKKSSSSPSPSAALFAKNLSLLALVFQNVALVLMVRHSRTVAKTEDSVSYIVSTAVVTAEVVKLVLNFTLELVLVKHDDGPWSILKGIFSRESIKLLVPSLLYVIQNNLLFVALGNLTVPVYQVTTQGKILTTAAFSRVLLNKSISTMQYVSLVILALGVATVQLSSMEQKSVSATAADSATYQNQALGLIAVGCSCITSGAAGVYFEKILKSQKSISVYVRNCQLALWSILLGLIPVMHDWKTIQINGSFFAGYNGVVVGVIACQAGAGLLVALVMKYADTILKGFATSVAVVLATVISIVFSGSKVDGWFAVGAAMVMYSVRLYSKHPPAAFGAAAAAATIATNEETDSELATLVHTSTDQHAKLENNF